MEKIFYTSQIVKDKLLSGEAFDYRFSSTKNELHNCRIRIVCEDEITISKEDLNEAIRYSYEYNTINPELLVQRLFNE